MVDSLCCTAEGLGKQPQPFTGRKSSLNSSPGAPQPLEERVGSVLKAAGSPSPGSSTVPTAVQLTVQSDRDPAALSLLVIIFCIIPIFILNVINTSPASIRLVPVREKVRQGKLCMPILRDRS